MVGADDFSRAVAEVLLNGRLASGMAKEHSQNWWRLGGGPEELTRILVSLPGSRIPEDEPE